MNDKQMVRVDKWLWAVRVFKTRSMATNACKSGKVSSGGVTLKPAHSVKIGQEINVRSPVITRTFIVKGLLEKRVSAKLAVEFVDEVTPQAEFDRLKALRNSPFGFREKGAGRPTKRDRRDIERIRTVDSFDSWDDDWAEDGVAEDELLEHE